MSYWMLHDKINKTRKKKSGGQDALSGNLEAHIVNTLDLLTVWKFSFDGYGVRCLVNSYLDNKKLIKVWKIYPIYPALSNALNCKNALLIILNQQGLR